MPVPALRIPLSLSMDEFERSTRQAQHHVGTVTRAIVRQFGDMNKLVVGETAAMAFGVGKSILATQTAFRLGLGAAAFVGIIAAVKGVRDELAGMVELADKASAARVSPEFFQAFTAAAKVAHAEVEVFEAALERAANATKSRLNVDVSPLDADAAKRAWQDVEQSITRAAIILQTTRSQEFFGGQTQQDRILAVLHTMQDLQAAGQRIEALDLGEKMFGSKFIDQIREGKVTIDELATTIETRLVAKDIVSNENVLRAKELDQRLNDAWNTVDKNLQPSFSALHAIALNIKSAWVGIVEAIAQATGLIDKLGKRLSESDRLRLSEGRQTILEQLEQGTNASPQRRRQLERQLADIDSRIGPITAEPTASGPKLAPITLREIAALGKVDKKEPKAEKAAAAESLDQIERFISALERSRDVLQAEFDNIGKSNVERAKAIELARAEAAARLANRDLTDSEREKILALAEAQAVLADKIKSVRDAQSDFADAMKSFIGDLRAGKAPAEAFFNAVSRGMDRIIDRQIDALSKGINIPSLFRGSGDGGTIDVDASEVSNFHTGGIVGGGEGGRRMVHPGVFRGARRFHGGGLTSGEIPAILKKGEGVFTPGQMAALGRGGAPMVNNISIVNSAGAQLRQQTAKNASGGLDFKLMIDASTAENVRAPGSATNRALRQPSIIAR